MCFFIVCWGGWGFLFPGFGFCFDGWDLLRAVLGCFNIWGFSGCYWVYK